MNCFDRELENINGLETEYIKLLTYDLPGNYKEKYRAYEYSRLCTIIDGEKRIIKGSENITYDKNKYLLLKPNSSVDIEIDVPTKALVIEISEYLIDFLTKKVVFELEIDREKINKNNMLIYSVNEISEYLNKIKSITFSKEKNKEFLIDLYAQELTYSIIKNKGVHTLLKDEQKSPINRAIGIMKTELSNGISIAEIADSLNMSISNFSHKFKNHIGFTPNQYLTNLKLLQAKQRLKFQSVTEVAYDLGYENVSHFIKLFKKKFGITPKQYKLNLR